MPCINLKGEMAKNGITIEAIAKLLGIHRNSAANKINGDEGGMRSVPRKDNTALCFTEMSSGQYRLRPLYYVSDRDKAWYKDYYGIRYSDAYEVYGLTRTGCCGCPISYKAIDDLELIRPYEPNVVKAAWNIFGKSYEYRKKYNEYKRMRMNQDKEAAANVEGQMSIDDFLRE